MTKYGGDAKGAVKLLDDINKNGIPKIDSSTREALEAYRATIQAVGSQKTKAVESVVYPTRLEILDKVLGK